MKLHRAAALALAGWYLMVPPQPVAKYWERPPLSKWEHYGSYDTAAECEQDRQAQAFQITRKDPNHATEAEKQLFYQFTIGKCISSDDPRLKGN